METGNTIQHIIPQKRINSIDALRAFALIGIVMWHCMEHFDLLYQPVLSSPFWQKIDTGVFDTLQFLFAGKAYGIFSLLFGLSFFMQMDSQASKGVDFRWRFLWRLALLLVLGYINGIVYMGEFFVVYAIFGTVLIPLYKVPSKWIVALAILMFLQIPAIISFISLLNGSASNEPTALNTYMASLYEEGGPIFMSGSVWDVLRFNLWKGEVAKMLWVINNFRYLQLIGLFCVGMLIGRMGIHKSDEKIIQYSKKVLPYSIAVFGFFYSIALLLPYLGIEGYALESGKMLFINFANLGQMTFYICMFALLYYKFGAGKWLDKIAPLGRMSVTNYMMQSWMGVILFYGFGANLTPYCSYLECALIGLTICFVQVLFSNWWIKRYYYGPMEWLWRIATWMKPVPLRRNKNK